MKKETAVFLIAAGLGILASPPAALAEGDPVTMAFHEKNGHFDVQAGFEVKADPKLVWDTLTDYEDYPRYLHELKKVQVQEKSENHMTVDEIAESGVLFFTQRVYFLMDVTLAPGRSIVSEDKGHKSFVSYRSEWGIQPLEGGAGTTLTYQLQAEGHFGAPAFMINDSFSGGVRNFLRNMRQEILRRQSKQAPTPASTAASSAPAVTRTP